MENDIEKIKDSHLTANILHVIKGHKSPYFNAGGIRFGLFKKYGYLLTGRPYSSNGYNDDHLKRIVNCKIGHVVRKLKSFGFLEKISNSTWKVIKPFEESMIELYTKKERISMGEQVG